jgi:hypothetical protein
MSEYISTNETAVLIRAQLKKHFPGVKFSVRSSKYSGGSSIDVRWVDGPKSSAVDRIAKPFSGSEFDGMIDLKYSVDAFLLPDGSVQRAGTRGSAGAGGVDPKEHRMMPAVPGVRRVRFSVDFVFCQREISQAHQAWVRARWEAMSESERSEWMRRTGAFRSACPMPQSWGYDAALSDFGTAATDVFHALARQTAAAA